MVQTFVGVGILLFASTAFAQSVGTAADKAFIEKAEAELVENVTTRDCTILERVLAEDFVGIDVDGSHYVKTEDVEQCKSKPSPFASDHLDRVQVRFYGEMAIAQGSESWKLKNGRRGRFVWTDTWLKRNGKWQIVASEDLIPVANPSNEMAELR